MRVGILAVGSLLWDEHPMREAWRTSRLRLDGSYHVEAPIRYGRRSTKRSLTYTMVFSADRIIDGRGSGVGMVIPCRAKVESPDDLLEEAAALWRAESNSSDSNDLTVSDDWGSIAVLLNPAVDSHGPLVAPWRETVSRSPHYGKLQSARGEPAVVDPRTGLALLPWPQRSGSAEPIDFDLLLLAATDPHIVEGRYVNATTVAEAWQGEPRHADYFWNNQQHGIETADDRSIRLVLESS